MLNPPGRARVFAVIIVKNDPATLTTAYCDAIASIRRISVRLALDARPAAFLSGDPLGLNDYCCEPLVILSFTFNWDERQDDECVKTAGCRAAPSSRLMLLQRLTEQSHRYWSLTYGAW